MTISIVRGGKPVAFNQCEYGQHEVNRHRTYYYWDETNGLPKDGVRICYECYAKHILKYYPNGKVAEYIRNNPNEYKNQE